MKILNMVIPILMHFCAYLALNLSLRLKLECNKPRHTTKCDVINDVIFLWLYIIVILSLFFFTLLCYKSIALEYFILL